MNEVTLRPLRRDDATSLHAIFTEPGVRLYLFDDVLLTSEETQEHVDAAVAHGAWAIVVDGTLGGIAALRPVRDDRELIVAVSERCWGKSVAFEAARAMIRHGFDSLGLARILATVDLPNLRSHRLMARLGFRPTGEIDGPKYRARTYVLPRP
ncbi:MAG: GNAT family N-acetyltransferase [Pseudomonadota bacterium]